MKVERTGPGILTIVVEDKDDLYAAYMPYVENGGLFFQTIKEYSLGEEVFMLLSLFDEPEKLPVAGKIVWLRQLAHKVIVSQVLDCSSVIKIMVKHALRLKPYLLVVWKLRSQPTQCRFLVTPQFKAEPIVCVQL